MTQEHTITPPPELVQQWWEEADQYQDDPKTYFDHVATQAARWGADQQLELDAKWLDHNALNEAHLKIAPMGEVLKEAMRPKLPTLKEQALKALEHAPGSDYPNPITLLTADEHALIRRALEQLDD